MDRIALLTSQSALLAVRESVVLRHGSTAAFDRALASIREALATSANGSPKETTRNDGWVDTAEAAKVMNCSPRWAREIAKRIGIQKGGIWLIPKDALPQEEQ